MAAAFAACTLTAVLTACAVGPNYKPPKTPTPDEWHALPQQGVRSESPDAPSLAAWWTALNDPQLDQLIERSIANNTSIKQSIARVKEARARRAGVMAGFLPGIGSSVGVTRADSESRFGGDTDFSSGGRDVYSAGLDASWELDLFGGQRRAFEASSAQLAAADADLRDVLVTLLGDVALGYTNVRTAQARLTYAERNLESQSEVLEIANYRAQAGLATSLDVDQAKSSYEQTRAQIPSLESSLEAAKNRLAVLTGVTPGSLRTELVERKPVPVAPLEIVAGVPADALRRRPDIRGAERRLAAQTAQVGVATAALFPSLRLNGSITLQSTSASDVLSDGLQSNRTGLSLSLPIFQGGSLLANIRANNALVESALASYEATVLAAYEEVENGLTEWVNEQRRHEALTQAADAARRASQLALIQYNSGLVDFQTVLNADRQLINLEDSLAVSDGEITSNYIRLYKSLGGGWSVFPAVTARAGGR